MIELIDDIPPYVAGFTASGEVSKKDYEEVLIPRVEEVFRQHGHIHFLYVLKTDVGNFTVNAWLKDLMIGVKHFPNWKRMAIVSDQSMVNKISSAISILLPGKTKGFSLENLEEAKNWVAGEHT